MKKNKKNSTRFFVLTAVLYCSLFSLSVYGDEYKKAVGGEDEKNVASRVLNILDVKSEYTKAERESFDKKFNSILSSYNLEKEFDGDVQSKDFYKKLDAIVFDRSNVFPIHEIVSSELGSIHIADGCKASIFDNLDKKQRESSVVVDKIVESLLKLNIVKGGKKNKAVSSKYMRSAILFSMINDKNAFYFGANFINTKSSIFEGDKATGFGDKSIDLIALRCSEDYSLFSKKYNDFLRQFDAYAVKNGVASKTGIVGDFDSLSKETMATRDALLDTTVAHAARVNWGFIRMLWLMKTCAKSSNDKKLDNLANAILDDIKNKSQYSFVKQWASEAMLEKNNGSNIPSKIWFGETVRFLNGALVIDANGDKKILIPYDPKDFDY